MNTPYPIILIALIFSTPAYSENLLEEIVVTATRTEKLLKDSPYAISVLTKEDLAFEPADQIAELLRDLPGVYISDA